MDKKTAGYFDYASATPVSGMVFDTMKPFFATEFYNPSALYGASQYSRRAIELARRTVAEQIGVRHSEIIFTSGCTEANNLAIRGVLDANPGGKVLISSIEHESVRQTAYNCKSDEIPVTTEGLADLVALESMITDDVVLVSVMYINNEIGTVQPLRKIAEIVSKVKKTRGTNGRPIYLHTDAAQAPNVRTISRSATGVDLMSLNGGKIYGPKGSGCLFVSSQVKINPIIHGGGQERNLRSGTENTPAIIGFAAALKDAGDKRSQEAERLGELQHNLQDGLRKLNCTVVTQDSPRSEAIISVLIPRLDSETAVYKLDKLGIYVSSGSACHAKTGVKSHVLGSLGLSDVEAMSAIRISLGRGTTASHVETFLKSLKEVLA